MFKKGRGAAEQCDAGGGTTSQPTSDTRSVGAALRFGKEDRLDEDRTRFWLKCKPVQEFCHALVHVLQGGGGVIAVGGKNGTGKREVLGIMNQMKDGLPGCERGFKLVE